MKIQRIIYEELIKEIEKKYISILIGPRQVGKTFLLREIEAACFRRGLKTRFYNLEDPTDLQFFTGTDVQVIQKLKGQADVIFIDEFHYLKNATRIMKVLYDSESRMKIFASGSSSMEIHKHLKESLAGRFRLTIIYPLYFKEEIQIKGYSFNEYLKYGGLPGLIHEKNPEGKMALLKNILQTYLLKDIKSLIKEENIRAYNHLLYNLAQYQGSVVPIAGLSREVGLSEPAVKYHLELMAQTYVCFPLVSYSKNLANELKKVKKYYLYDIGMRNSILNDFSSIERRGDKGEIIESFVYLSILKQLKSNMEVRFWRTRQGDEVDFILLKNRIPVPLEVKYQAPLNKVPTGMQRFLQKYKESPFGIIITKGGKGKAYFDNRDIKFMDLHEAETIDYLQSVE
jgi:predicted AAA+ superfamily ATPase